jgi:hypothetical protein
MWAGSGNEQQMTNNQTPITNGTAERADGRIAVSAIGYWLLVIGSSLFGPELSDQPQGQTCPTS